MKKFSFTINNFYSIFNTMPDGNNKNIDSYLDDNISQSLKSETSDDFSFEMMKRVEIEKEFAKQDRKTDNVAKFVIGGLLAAMIILSVGIPLLFGVSDTDQSPGYFSMMTDNLTGAIEYFSILTTENLGIAFNLKTLSVIIISSVFIFLFSKADKLLLKKF
ncbi:MAG: hypothetical protein IPM38_16200 [Ignavibacteria bacterium]|nr:hypothetical protein [Ignavibacteria bacterium]